jgi:hypothetical protein
VAAISAAAGEEAATVPAEPLALVEAAALGVAVRYTTVGTEEQTIA